MAKSVSAGDDRDGAVGNERDAVAAHAGADAHFDLGEPAHVVRVADVENLHAEGPHDERGSMVGDDCASLLVDDARIDVRDLFRMGRIGIVENVDAVAAGDERDGAVGKKRDARCELAGARDFDLGQAAHVIWVADVEHAHPVLSHNECSLAVNDRELAEGAVFCEDARVNFLDRFERRRLRLDAASASHEAAVVCAEVA